MVNFCLLTWAEFRMSTVSQSTWDWFLPFHRPANFRLYQYQTISAAYKTARCRNLQYCVPSSAGRWSDFFWVHFPKRQYPPLVQKLLYEFWFLLTGLRYARTRRSVRVADGNFLRRLLFATSSRVPEIHHPHKAGASGSQWAWSSQRTHSSAAVAVRCPRYYSVVVHRIS